MEKRTINAADAPAPAGTYSQAIEVRNATRTLYVSGQIPVAVDGTVPTAFADQARVAWQNVVAQLHAADMTLDNLVKVTIFLSDRRYIPEYRQVRSEFLGERRPALTCIITGIFDTAWLLEIEAVACA
ncbi:MAG: RidA family protein [Hyphomicrobium sp.]|nr:RidA family protein [Hyphomicrobium sp.]MBN9264707.1 RidA family protein [Hyphomicrobium sp.]MBN9278771.1 RidA family protein [Hyphomicrobium sp.]OJU25718.1 MAG: enamine deaminase RidA [Alphaproteobacteria bacterium 64-6]